MRFSVGQGEIRAQPRNRLWNCIGLEETGEVSGIPSVEVKFVDIGKNTSGEGGSLVGLTLRCESVGSKQD